MLLSTEASANNGRQRLAHQIVYRLLNEQEWESVKTVCVPSSPPMPAYAAANAYGMKARPRSAENWQGLGVSVKVGEVGTGTERGWAISFRQQANAS